MHYNPPIENILMQILDFRQSVVGLLSYVSVNHI